MPSQVGVIGISTRFIAVAVMCLSIIGTMTHGFSVLPPTATTTKSPTTSLWMSEWNSGGTGDPTGKGFGSQIETLEFKIYPDGRVEETVRGVRGADCMKV